MNYYWHSLSLHALCACLSEHYRQVAGSHRRLRATRLPFRTLSPGGNSGSAQQTSSRRQGRGSRPGK